MAHDWGRPPWEIEEAEDGAYWARAWEIYQQEAAFVRKFREKT